ncbi:MAG: MauE/DoxX family redox-associated membrane protein [Candidatus Coatesbacteria bacterium]
MTALCRLILSAIFALAALGGLEHPKTFMRSVGDYQLLPPGLVPLAGATLPGVEALAALVLLLAVFRVPETPGRWRAAVEGSELIVTGLLVVYTVGIASALLRGFQLDCGCFDFLGEHLPFYKPSKATWWTVVRDLVMMVPGVWLVSRQRWAGAGDR